MNVVQLKINPLFNLFPVITVPIDSLGDLEICYAKFNKFINEYMFNSTWDFDDILYLFFEMLFFITAANIC